MGKRRAAWQGTVVKIKRKGMVVAYQARVPYLDDLGKPQTWHKNKPSQRAAEIERARLVQQRDTQGLHRAERRTVAQEAEHWLSTVKRGKLRPTSLHAYQQRMRAYVLPYIGHLELTALKRQHCETWQRTLLDRGLSHSLINAVTDMVVHMLDRLVPGTIPHNPARIERLEKVRAPRRALTPEEVDRVVVAYKALWFRRFLTILFWTGLRSGELAGLRLPDVHEGDLVPHIRIVGTRWQLGHDRGVHDPKTDAGIRTIPLLPPALQAIREQRVDQIALLRAFGASFNPEQYLFVTRTERPYSHSQLYIAWRQSLERAGLPPLPLHTTRHTTATLLLAADVPLRIQRAILGHASDAQTWDYQHPDLEILATGMERVTAYLERRKQQD